MSAIESCGACGADLGPSTAYPWHLPDEDCRAVREPLAHETAVRLEELRQVLRSESISWGELAELQGLAGHIEPGDVELLEAAGVPEFPDDSPLLDWYAPESGVVFDFADLGAGGGGFPFGAV